LTGTAAVGTPFPAAGPTRGTRERDRATAPGREARIVGPLYELELDLVQVVDGRVAVVGAQGEARSARRAEGSGPAGGGAKRRP
jgi:hypothetical protein